MISNTDAFNNIDLHDPQIIFNFKNKKNHYIFLVFRREKRNCDNDFNRDFNIQQTTIVTAF